ncbi:unnamed protein product, partial [Penicillium nalgiovense]
MSQLTWLAMMVVMAFQVIHQADGKAVFAHFMVTNSENYTISDWESDMKLAQDAHIDAFALNMAWKDGTNDASVKKAFIAANTAGFMLFFSFDYAGNGPWNKDVVIDMIQEYGPNSAYFHYDGKPFVSTFEGPDSADDWVKIKARTGCFFMPDWSSVGAKPAIALANGVADGLFSWSAWPWGNQTMDTYTDASYIQYLDGKPYMIAISPWFYTNLPGYNKNWIWKGDSLWFDRWQQLFGLDPMPEFVQIISWNDYGESHYIGPIYDKSMAAFDIGEAPYNYVMDHPHDAWRKALPFLIDVYKLGKATMTDDIVIFWYRRNFVSACSPSGTTVNTASQLQIEFEPSSALEDRIFVMGLFQTGNSAVFVNNHDIVVWDSGPSELEAGVWFGSVAATTGRVRVDLLKGDATIGSAVGPEISHTCEEDFNNFNAWVGSVSGGIMSSSDTTSIDLADQACVEGKGAYDFNDLCSFTCSYGYCPVGACTCERMGVARKMPNATGTIGYPAEGKDANYLGLCNFACNLGNCPSRTCDTAEHPMPVPSVSDFLPPACVAGTGEGQATGLCSYACGYGYCPINLCTCTMTGALVQPPAQTEGSGMAGSGQSAIYDNLCDFTCSRGYCPSGTCMSKEEVSTSNINPHWVVEDGKTCTDYQRKGIEVELEYAIDMAESAANNLQQGVYLQEFFGDAATDAQFVSDATETFRRIAELLSGNVATFPVKLSCEQTEMCQNEKAKIVAYMNNKRQLLNFCELFFANTDDTGSTVAQIVPTKKLISNTEMDLRTAARSRSAVLVHEATHTRYAMLDRPYTRDYAYGFDACWQLPRGLFDRSCAKWVKKPEDLKPNEKPPRIECPVQNGNGKIVEGLCSPATARRNAESFQFLAAGIYFTAKTGRDIPLPPTPQSVTKRADSCVSSDDSLNWDNIWYDDAVVTGQVHFGDSFAAGMGTGKTSRDKCRLGSANYGQLLHNSFAEGIPFQNLACSGDTVAGLYDKLSGWTNPTVDNVATMTIGGNDVGFSDIVKHCILRYFNSYTLWDAWYCSSYKKAARNLIDDTSADGLQYKLTSIYLRIIRRTQSNPDFHLYIPGYPRFFNAETTECNEATFRWWSWKVTPEPNDVYLTTSLREEMNDLVTSLNQVIKTAVIDANNLANRNVTHFVDVDPRFEGHRWCEAGVKEPDSSHKTTDFFLSGWPDIKEGDTVQSSSPDESADLSALQTGGSLPIPDGKTCNTTLGLDPDPVDVYWCDLAVAITQEPDGDLARHVAAANGNLANGDFTAQDIRWFLPTRQIKA